MAQRILALELVGDRVRAAVAERSWNSFTLAGVYDKVRADDEADLSGALSRLVVEAGQPDIVTSSAPFIHSWYVCIFCPAISCGQC